MKNKKFLVTGGTGFIGSHLVNRLLTMGEEVHVIAHSENNFWRLENIDKINMEIIDIKDLDKLNKFISKLSPDIIVHLAAYVNAERDLNGIDMAIDNNFNGTLNLLKSLNNIDYDLFINTGTCEEYGDGGAPFQENQREHPVSPYSLSKTCSTYLCELFSKIYDKPIITVRPFLTYGPKQTSQMLIPELIRKGINGEKMKLTAGEQSRDFIYIDDLIDAFIILINNYNEFDDYEIINIGTGRQILIKDIVKLIGEFLPKSEFELGALSYRKGETMEFYSDNSLIKKLGWKDNTSIKNGLEETIDWWNRFNKRGNNNG
ncbi:NAD(P)-dependent oxidoreductase [Halanaerobium sp.]|uniref:NAD-dependent epimerase/dehydratase family protein n=1 Tax=Halanaerobium sp. TaxID=1895664 RepID=UPI000DE68461|nr:NAD-dependent epimerase/dehydratase family protein [Halanaerobium sp.]PUU88931.1 MAG: dTDP-glucose 4,6-dehydratase [Halanaerobium sp.]